MTQEEQKEKVKPTLKDECEYCGGELKLYDPKWPDVFEYECPKCQNGIYVNWSKEKAEGLNERLSKAKERIKGGRMKIQHTIDVYADDGTGELPHMTMDVECPTYGADTKVKLVVDGHEYVVVGSHLKLAVTNSLMIGDLV